MKKRLIIGLILVMLLCLLVPVSCAPSRPAGPPEPPIVPPTTPEPITVTPEEPSTTDVDVSDYPSYTTISIPIEAFPGQPHIDVVMNAAVGEELTVTLGSNPTTGFQWSEDAKISDESVIKKVSHKFVGPGIDKPPGTPGEEVWTFKALKKGRSTINLEYSRSWEEKDAEWTVTITVNIN
jgi:predicted secreted protein